MTEQEPQETHHPSPEDVYHHDFQHHPDNRPKVSFWRKLGGGSLSISLIIHGIFLAVAVVWIFQIIPQKPPVPDFMPSGGGGGAPTGVQNKVKAKQRMTMTSNAPRVAAKDVVSSFTLPEPEAGAQMSALGGLSAGAMSGGLGGSGSGGGRGSGAGTGFGTGMGAGMGGGSAKLNPFGMVDPNANALVGSFYDLKQTERRAPTPLGKLTNFGEIVNATREVLHDFVKRGWSERDLSSKYYQAPQKLYQTKVFMPNMKADEAPKAFNCEKEVQGSRWVVIYRGVVRPPKSGKYRFVGAGDDVLAVRFNGNTVFDFGYESVTGNLSIRPNKAKMADPKDREWKRTRKDWAMPEPLEIRPQGSGLIIKDLGGIGVGMEFEAKTGVDYPIEILISEIPGGYFAAYLMIEEIGATYQKDKNGAPILPAFRLDANPPAQGEGPPYDPNSAPWQLVQGRQKVGF
ncbi:MAG TPA: hypothetical protein VIM46_04935 [Luteolibacter sp.]